MFEKYHQRWLGWWEKIEAAIISPSPSTGAVSASPVGNSSTINSVFDFSSPPKLVRPSHSANGTSCGGGEKVRHDAPPPAGVEALPVAGFDETIYWLPGPRALVPGDRLIGDGSGGVRMCPPSWLDYLPDAGGIAALRDALAPLLELPVEHVLVSHGEPVVGDGRKALAAALTG